MKREFLKGLGLTDEQIEKIMGENGKDVQAEVEKAQGISTELDTLRKQVTDRDKDIANLKKQTGDSGELKTQLETLQAKYQADTEKLSQKLAEQKLDSALDAAIHAAKGRNGKAIKALLNREALKLKDDGTLEGLDLDALKKSDAYLFEIEQTRDEGSDPASGSGSGNTAVTQEIFKQNINNVAWMQANMDAVTQGLANGSLTKG